MIGFIANFLIKAVHERFHMQTDDYALAAAAEAGRARRLASPASRSAPEEKQMADNDQNGTPAWHLLLAWGFVGIPLVWGVAQTIANSMKLFQ